MVHAVLLFLLNTLLMIIISRACSQMLVLSLTGQAHGSLAASSGAQSSGMNLKVDFIPFHL